MLDASAANAIKGRAPLRASAEIRAAIQGRGKHNNALIYVHSTKIRRDLVACSDIEFLHFLHLEAHEDVKSYEPDAERIIAHLGEDGYAGSKPDAIVNYRSGQIEMVEVKYAADLKDDPRAQSQAKSQGLAAGAKGMTWSAYTERDALAEERLLHDWLQILGCLNRAPPSITATLLRRVRAAVADREKSSLQDIRALALGEWSSIFPALFLNVQAGYLRTDLQGQPLSPSTRLFVSQDRL